MSSFSVRFFILKEEQNNKNDFKMSIFNYYFCSRTVVQDKFPSVLHKCFTNKPISDLFEKVPS